MLQKIQQLNKLHIVGLIAMLIILLAGAYFFLAQRASRHAANIFNYFMSRQEVLIGQVTADGLSADIWGNVYFSQLKWVTPKGETLLEVPEGRLKIKPWDIVLRRAGIDTVEDIELHDAYLHLGFDDKMHLDILQKDADSEQEREPMSDTRKHLQMPKRLPNIKLILQNTVIDADYKKRCFVLNDVNGYVEVRSHNRLQLSLSAGKYGGSIAGEGLNIDGRINLAGEQDANVNIGLYEVVPASLGLGNVNDAMTVTGQLMGPLHAPVIDGAVSMKELHLPGLYFTKINGNYHYENALISFKDVAGSIYGGTLEAIGLYHFDNHHYKIDAKGKGLMASAAAKSSKINTSVNLDIKFRNLGRHGNNLTYGSFESGRGTFMLMPFKKIKGSFSDQSGELVFTNVEIETNLGRFESGVFKLVRGKLQLGDVFLVDDRGQRRRVR